jgi:hypothetical protein
MKILVRRGESKDFTPGEMFMDGEFFCYTCEDPVRKKKIKGITAIPSGVYRVILSWSNRFQKTLPLLIDVPNFEGVRFHAGNTAADTEGCILVGLTKTPTGVGDSRKAMALLMPKLKAAHDNGEHIEITI